MAYQPKTNDQDKAVADSLDSSSAGHAMLNPNMDIYASAQITEMMIPSMMQLGKIQQMRASQNQASRNIRSAVSDDSARVEADQVFNSTMGDLDKISGITDPIERERELSRITESDPRRLSNPRVMDTINSLRNNARQQTASMADSLQRKQIDQAIYIHEETDPMVRQNAVDQAGLQLSQTKDARDKWGADQDFEEVASKDFAHSAIAGSRLPPPLKDKLTGLTETIGGDTQNRGHLRTIALMGQTAESAMRIESSFAPSLEALARPRDLLWGALQIDDAALISPTPEQESKLDKYLKANPTAAPEIYERRELLRTMSLAKQSREDLHGFLMGKPEVDDEGKMVPGPDGKPVLEGGAFDELSKLYKSGDMVEFKEKSAIIQRKMREISEVNRNQIEDQIRDNEDQATQLKLNAAIQAIRNSEARMEATTIRAKASSIAAGARSAGIKANNARQIVQSALNSGDIKFPSEMRDATERMSFIADLTNQVASELNSGDSNKDSHFNLPPK